jgi:ATP-dependent Clp protease, protease subunit
VQKIRKQKKDKEGERNLNTIVTETTEFGEVPIDIYQKLSNDRILFLNNEIDNNLASDFCATLLLKDNENKDEVVVFINSDGGDIRSALMIYDTMRMVECPIKTICLGFAMDEAAIILTAGTPGLRFATKNSIIAVGQLADTGSMMGNVNSAKTLLDQAVRDNNRMMEIIAKHSKKPLNEVNKLYQDRVFMTAAAAVKHGIIDAVISHSKKD